jgi:probable phosphoglycerate mutase
MVSPDDSAYRQVRFRAAAGSTHLILIRHGESAPFVPGEPEPTLDGHADPELAEIGCEQAERVADRLAGVHFDAVYVTPLRRTAQTAAPLLARHGVTARVKPGLQEANLGELEGGMLRVRTLQRDPMIVRMWAEQSWDFVPGAETMAQFSTRIRRSVEEIAADHPDQRVAVFTHGGVIGQIISIATGAAPLAFGQADNASITHVVLQPKRWTVRRYNDTTHLRSDFSTEPSMLT